MPFRQISCCRPRVASAFQAQTREDGCVNPLIPGDEVDLRAAYHEYIGKYGKSRAITAMATDYGCTAQTVRRHLALAGIRAIREMPERPAEGQLRELCAAIAAEHGTRAMTGRLATEIGVTQTTVRQWMADYGIRAPKPRAAAAPILDPCPCGAVATTRYRGQDPPLCFRCYMRSYARDQQAAGTQSRTSRNYGVSLKEGKPCTDCGGMFPTYVLHWDHVPGRGQKLFNIGAGDYSLATVQTEIAKCDLVCANCHAVRTWNRRRKQGVAPEEEFGLPVAGGTEAAAVTAGAVLI